MAVGRAWAWASMALAFSALSSACKPEPARLHFRAEPPSSIHTLEPIRLPEIVVEDANGKPIDPQPPIRIRATPGDAVLVDGLRLSALRNGHVQLLLTVPGTQVSDVRELDVRLVNKVELACPGDCSMHVGETIQLTPKFLNDKLEVQDVRSHWAIEPEGALESVAPGKLKAVKAAKATVTVSVGSFFASQAISVLGDEAPDRVIVSCPEVRRNVFDPEAGCIVRLEETAELPVTASREDRPVVPPAIEWSSDDPSIATAAAADEGVRITPLHLGKTTIRGRVGEVESTLTVSVTPPACSENHVERFPLRLHADETLSIRCQIPDARTCWKHFVDKEAQKRRDFQAGLRACCCEIEETEPEPEEVVDYGETPGATGY